MSQDGGVWWERNYPSLSLRLITYISHQRRRVRKRWLQPLPRGWETTKDEGSGQECRASPHQDLHLRGTQERELGEVWVKLLFGCKPLNQTQNVSSCRENTVSTWEQGRMLDGSARSPGFQTTFQLAWTLKQENDLTKEITRWDLKKRWEVKFCFICKVWGRGGNGKHTVYKIKLITNFQRDLVLH